MSQHAAPGEGARYRAENRAIGYFLAGLLLLGFTIWAVVSLHGPAAAGGVVATFALFLLARGELRASRN
jgi:hypothetical protein